MKSENAKNREVKKAGNIEWYGILEALLGFSYPPFEEPLNCIGSDVMAIQIRAHYLMFDFSESLNKSFVPSTGKKFLIN